MARIGIASVRELQQLRHWNVRMLLGSSESELRGQIRHQEMRIVTATAKIANLEAQIEENRRRQERYNVQEL